MIKELSNVCEVLEDEQVRNTFKLDSKCAYMVKPNNIDELKSIIDIVKKNKSDYIVLGNSSNVILPRYYDGVVIKLDNFNTYEVHDDCVECGAGVMLNKIANELVNMGYAGLDFAVGVPGSIGGSVYGNAGCFGSSISEVLIDAKVFDGKKVITLSNEDLKFDYRYSLLKEKKNYIVLSARFKIHKGNIDELKERVKEINNKRMTSQDLTHPSNGSVFRNPEGYSAGKLIDDLGLKGYSVNGASVSLIHANFIINNGNATQEDIIKLIDHVKTRVKDEYGIELRLEQEIIK